MEAFAESSSAPYFIQDKATENFFRLSQLIMTVCTDLFRDILSRHIKPIDLISKLEHNKGKLEKIFNTQQKKLIYPIPKNTSLVAKDLDISTLYIILRNICNIPEHKNKWGNPPLKGDNSIAACIERIKHLRNLISGHSTNGRVEDIDFQNHWAELQGAVVEIEQQLVGGNLYERGVDLLLTCDISRTITLKHECKRPLNPPNVITSQDTSIKTNEVKLIAKVFPYDKFSETQEVFWTKNGVKIDFRESGVKYSGFDIEDQSLTIHNVNHQDAGSYQITAINSVGSTSSDIFVIDVPKVFLVKNETKGDGSQCFKMTVQSFPASICAQWKIKEKDGYAYEILDVNADEYKGSLNSLPHPVLVIKQTERLKTHCFKIDVHNFIGTCSRIISADSQPDIPESDSKVVLKDCLERFYNEEGANIRFANIFDELAERVPESKLNRLKDIILNSCREEAMYSIRTATSARDCFRILNDAKLFTPTDMIFAQYILKKLGCAELFAECVKYAETQKALCFYEKPPENGLKNVQFHVQGNLSEYSSTQIKKIKETVAVIVGCSSDDVLVSGICPSTSFLVVLSLKDIYLDKLMNMKQLDKDDLQKLNIDYVVVDLTTVFLKPTKEEREWNIYFDPNYQRSSKNENEFEEGEPIPLQLLMSLKEEYSDNDSIVSGSICSTSLEERVIAVNPKTEFGAVNTENITDVFASYETKASQQDVSPSATIEQIRKSVGHIFIHGKHTGMGFRVGDKYILTCAHVVKSVLSDSPNAIKPDQIIIEFDGMENNQREDCSTVFGFKPSIAYFDKEYDFSVLELAPNEVGTLFPPPFTYFSEVCATEIHLVGPSDDKHIKVDSGGMPGWFLEHKDDIEGLFKQKTTDFTETPKKIFFQTTLGKGCSGSPGFKMLDGKPYIMLMLAGEIRRSLSKKLNYGIALSDIRSKIISSESQCDKSFASTIFPEWDTGRSF